MDTCTGPSNDILAILDARTTAMTIAECADLLHADPGTLYRHSKSGKFPTFQVIGMVRVNPAELAAHIGPEPTPLSSPSMAGIAKPPERSNF